MRRPLVGSLLLLAGACCALTSGWLVYHTVRTAGRPVAVVVAAHDLAPYSRLAPTDLREATLPAAAVSPWMVGSAREMAGRFLRVPVLEGTPIDRRLLVDQGGLAGQLAGLGQSGWRALSLPIDASTGLAGRLAVGDRVDLVAASRTGAQTSAQVVASGVPVLDVVEDPRGGGRGTAIVALPAEAVVPVAYALQTGSVRLALDPFGAMQGPGAGGGAAEAVR